MRRKVSTIVAGMALLLAWPALADWDVGDGHKMHFPQLPDPDGWDVCLCCQWIADDFTCGETGYITDIHFWTSWKADDAGVVDSWDITIWDDAGGMPGTQLWPVAGSIAGTFTTRWYGSGQQGWICPSPPSLIVPNDHINYYQVNVTDIVDPFWQEEGTNYWLVIRAIISWPPPPAVGWKTSVNDPPALYQAPAKWSTDQINWADVDTGTVEPELHDMAFVITGGPHQEDLDFGDAPEGVLAYPSSGTGGMFPTCITVGPAGWIQHGLCWAHFGPGFDFEADGNGGLCPGFAPYDNDECFADGDAGLMFPEPFTIQGGVEVPCPNGNGTPLGTTCQIAVWGVDVDIDITNAMPVDGYVNVLMDWNQNGLWAGSSTCHGPVLVPEHVLVDFGVPAGYSGPLSGLGPPSFVIGPNPGYVWTRFTVSELPVGTDWNGQGSFEDGETEDYLLLVEEGLDFGDAPDPTYPTWSANNGANHTIVPGVLMGASIDGEPDGQPDPNALGDDLDGNDDEDGVTLSILWPGGPATATIDLTSSVGGFLNAWIDYDGDGSWGTTASEQIFTNQALTGGVVNALAFTVPASAVSGTVTFARFRFDTGGGLSYVGWAPDGEVEDYEVFIQDEPANYLFEFSLDIGSDIELSDPNTNGNEAADPGDVYWWQSAPIVPPGRDGFKDDMFIFGTDPNPDPPDPFVPPATRVPVGTGTIQDYYEYFDLDGHDQLDAELQQMEWPIPQFDSPCVHYPDYLMISYDDDMAPGWPAGDVPVTVASPAGFVYGTTLGRDEIVGVNLMVVGPPPFPVLAIYPIADEITVHLSMQPNPDMSEYEDDDVDSLDIVPSEEDLCPYWYFSPDHEAHLGLDPGGIYQVTGTGPVQVIDEAFHLGLSEDTDIDAFEFTWIEDPDGTGGFYLGLLFSVDENDPLTTLAVDESGGLDPTALYASIMTGSSWRASDPLGDDVDALTIWRESFIPPCNPLDVRSLKPHTGVGELPLNMGVKDGIEPRAGGADKLEIDLDDASGFLGGVVVNCSPTVWMGMITTSTVGNTVTLWFSPPLSGQSYCEIVLDCGALVCVRNCEADMNRDGFTNPTDAAQVKLRFGQTATAANCEWDWDLSGAINPTDAAASKLRFGYSAPQCP